MKTLTAVIVGLCLSVPVTAQQAERPSAPRTIPPVEARWFPPATPIQAPRTSAPAPVRLASAATITATATWDANPESDIAGYKLSYGIATGVYTTLIDCGKVTTFVVPGLLTSTRYFFVLQAYNTAGLSSPFSAEVPYTTPTGPVPTAVIGPPTLR
jgi:hypothetical protein